jgi:hypothetical protein
MTETQTAITRDEVLDEARATALGAYLIIARYNRARWRGLNSAAAAKSVQAGSGAVVDRQEEAHETAEKVFPEEKPDVAAEPAPVAAAPETEAGVALPPLTPVPVPDVPGVLMMRSFHTYLFNDLERRIIAHFDQLRGGPTTEEALSTEVDGIFREWNLLDESGTNGTTEVPADKRIAEGQQDPGIGWIAMIDVAYYTEFVNQMGGVDGPLWTMYDIEVIPLNADRTTKDVYDFMTPVNWRK